MMTALQTIYWVAAFITLAEALNKLERTDPCAAGLTWNQRLVDGLKAIAWLLLACGAAWALISPLLVPLGVPSGAAELLAHYEPSVGEVCWSAGFAVLIVRTRVKEG